MNFAQMSIFIDCVYIHDKKLNKNELENVDNTFLIILQKIVCVFILQSEISRAYNRRFYARIVLNIGKTLVKSLCISLSL